MLWVGACYKETLALCAPESDRGPWSWKKEILITFFFTIFANRGTLEGHRTPWADFILLGFANRQVSVVVGLRPYCSKVVAT